MDECLFPRLPKRNPGLELANAFSVLVIPPPTLLIEIIDLNISQAPTLRPRQRARHISPTDTKVSIDTLVQ
jgi:hypothetical protein